MPRETQVLLPLTGSTTGSLPRAAWIFVAVLGLAAAGLAGALVMQSMTSAPASPVAPATAVAGLETSASPAEAPVPSNAQAAKSGRALPAAPAKAPAHVGSGARPAPAVAAGPADAQRAQPAPSGDSPAQAGSNLPAATTQAVACVTCGVVESVNPVQQPGQATGVGAVAGGVLGGVVGHQVGGGNGKTAMTVLGALGGAFAGNEVEKRTRSETHYSVQVRMEDGSMRVFQQAQSLAIGTRVVVDGSKLKVVARDAATGSQPQLVRTAAQPGANT